MLQFEKSTKNSIFGNKATCLWYSSLERVPFSRRLSFYYLAGLSILSSSDLMENLALTLRDRFVRDHFCPENSPCLFPLTSSACFTLLPCLFHCLFEWRRRSPYFSQNAAQKFSGIHSLSITHHMLEQLYKNLRKKIFRRTAIRSDTGATEHMCTTKRKEPRKVCNNAHEMSIVCDRRVSKSECPRRIKITRI